MNSDLQCDNPASVSKLPPLWNGPRVALTKRNEFFPLEELQIEIHKTVLLPLICMIVKRGRSVEGRSQIECA